MSTRSHARVRVRSGLTLVELVLALAIAGMAVSAGAAALGTLVDRRTKVEELTRDATRAWALRTTLTDWLHEAHSDPGGTAATFRGLDGVHGDVPDDELTFLTSARTPLGDGETLVRLYIMRDSAGLSRGLAADLSAWRGQQHMTLQLDTAVVGLDIRFRSALVSASPWIPSWVSSSVLPAGVELTLLPASPKSVPPLLLVPLLVPLAGR